ncbi:hypothetical protein ElyMa_004716000 [Elysia marginata]|uniref:Uncharacterized protein n=1 Tax=Elysia marginata TaxID=1093978 RepID=A0AAV4I9F9_9GAST|nr:hypothetical protein ElyMa_004716000 [Elysia marginata]
MVVVVVVVVVVVAVVAVVVLEVVVVVVVVVVVEAVVVVVVTVVTSSVIRNWLDARPLLSTVPPSELSALSNQMSNAFSRLDLNYILCSSYIDLLAKRGE